MWERLRTSYLATNVAALSQACGTCNCTCGACNCSTKGTWEAGASSAFVRSFGNATAEVVDPPKALGNVVGF
jgi:hypothetical protein